MAIFFSIGETDNPPPREIDCNFRFSAKSAGGSHLLKRGGIYTRVTVEDRSGICGHLVGKGSEAYVCIE